MTQEIKIVPIELENGSIIHVQATSLSETEDSQIEEEIESDVSLNIRPLQNVADAITGIAESLKEAMDAAKPSKACIEFGVEFGYESGKITALIVKGTATANLKISLEWDKSE